jgi:hypothetical protein
MCNCDDTNAITEEKFSRRAILNRNHRICETEHPKIFPNDGNKLIALGIHQLSVPTVLCSVNTSDAWFHVLEKIWGSRSDLPGIGRKGSHYVNQLPLLYIRG